MALILAIEPDRRQAAQLARLIQARVGAELVLAETTEQALGAIGNRVPDLVLVPALLSPQDDATLATALRVIAAAAHVQMLTIPVLGAASGARQPLGVLARLRRRRAEPVAPDGCDPDVFGDQIAAYLKEAAAERAINASDLEIELSTSSAPHPKATQEFSQDSPELSAHVVLGDEGSLEEPTAAALPIAAAESFTLAEDETFTLAETVVEGTILELDVLGGRYSIDEPPAIEDVAFAAALDQVVTFAEEPAALLDVPKPREVSQAPWFGPQRRWPDLEGQEAVDHLTMSAAEETAGADADVQTVDFPAVVVSAIDDLTMLAAMDESAGVVVAEPPIDVQAALPATETVPFEEPAPGSELWMPLSFGATRSWPALEGVWSEARPDPPAPVHADPPAVAAAPPAPAPAPAAERVPQDAPAARPEWIELIESLRQDVKRLRTERTQVKIAGPRSKEIPTPGSRPSPPVRRGAVADVELTSKKRAKAAKPAQDEWGFFDPEQCGFAALLAKLDEITQITEGP